MHPPLAHKGNPDSDSIFKGVMLGGEKPAGMKNKKACFDYLISLNLAYSAKLESETVSPPA